MILVESNAFVLLSFLYVVNKLTIIVLRQVKGDINKLKVKNVKNSIDILLIMCYNKTRPLILY